MLISQENITKEYTHLINQRHNIITYINAVYLVLENQ